MPLSIRLLALDIDDTLTGSDGKVSRTNRVAIRRAIDLGVLVTAVTGRRYRNSADYFANDIGIAGPMACHYGRALVEHPSGRFLSRACVPEDVARRVVGFAAERKLIPSICAGETFFFDRSLPAKSVEGTRLPHMEWVDGFEDVFSRHGSQLMTVALSGEGAEEVRDLLRPEIEAGAVAVNLQRMTGRREWLAVVLAGGCDKGTALLDLCRRLGVNPSETAALGDSEADIPMLRAAGFSIAMPWAEDAVRAAADRVAAGTPEDAAGLEIDALFAAMPARPVSPARG